MVRVRGMTTLNTWHGTMSIGSRCLRRLAGARDRDHAAGGGGHCISIFLICRDAVP